MIIYWSIFVWVLLMAAAFATVQRKVYINGLSENRATLFQVLISSFPIIFFAGMKGRGIIDSGGYILSFQRASSVLSFDSLPTKDPGFALMEIAFKQLIIDDYQVWIFFLALVSSLGVLIPLYKNSPSFGLSLFFWVASAQFTWLFNGVRQYLAVTLLFGFIHLIAQKKLWKYLILIALLYTIHKTILIMIPAFFIAQLQPWNKRMYLVLFSFILLSFTISQVGPLFNFFLADTAYEGHMNAALETRGTNIFRLFMAAIPVGIFYIYRERIAKIAPPIIKVSLNMTVLHFAVFIVSTAVGGNLFGRFAGYFAVFLLITYPWLLIKVIPPAFKKIAIIVFILLYTAWFYLDMGDYPYISDTLKIYYW